MFRGLSQSKVPVFKGNTMAWRSSIIIIIKKKTRQPNKRVEEHCSIVVAHIIDIYFVFYVCIYLLSIYISDCTGTALSTRSGTEYTTIAVFFSSYIYFFLSCHRVSCVTTMSTTDTQKKTCLLFFSFLSCFCRKRILLPLSCAFCVFFLSSKMFVGVLFQGECRRMMTIDI